MSKSTDATPTPHPRALAFAFAAAVMLAAVRNGSAQEMTAFSDTTGQHVFYTSAGQHIVQLFWNTTAWLPQDLTSITGATTLATAGDRLTSFNDMTGEHVFYLGTNDHICQLFQPWGGQWVNQDLTMIGKATVSASPYFGPSASFSDISGEHAFYVGSDFHVHQLYLPWQGNWGDQDLTGNANGVLDDDGNLAAFADQTGEHVFYTDDSFRRLHQLYWAWGGTRWVDQDLTVATGGAPIISSGLTAFSDAWGEHVIYPALIGSSVHIDQLYAAWGHSWTNADLTTWNNGHLAAVATPVSSFTDVMAETVFYIDNAGQVNELYAHANWNNEDLSVLAQSSQTASVECQGWLTSFSDENGDHIFYVGATDGNIHQLYRNGSSTAWTDQDLTVGLPSSLRPWVDACVL